MFRATTIRDQPRPREGIRFLALTRPLGLSHVSRLTIPAAVCAAGWSLAHFSQTGAAETGFLTLIATAVLTSAVLLTPRSGAEPGVAAALAVLLIWVLPAGPGRGAGLMLLLLAVVLVAAVRRWGPLLAVESRGGAASPSMRELLVAAVPAVLGIQVLMEAGRWLDGGSGLATVGRYLLLPALSAVALAVLARIHGPKRALIGAAAVATAAGGWSAATALPLAALAAGASLARLDTDRSGLAAPTRFALRGIAALALVSPLLWQQRAGAVAVAGGLALALAGDPKRVPVGASVRVSVRGVRDLLPLAPAGAALAGAAMVPLHTWSAATAVPLAGVVLVPAALLALRAQPVLAASAVGLALAAGRAVPDGAALATPVALLALALPSMSGGPAVGRGGRVAASAVFFQGLWSAVLLAATVLAASYPWLRETPWEVAAGALGLASFGVGSAALIATVLVLAPTVGSGLGVSRRTLTGVLLAAVALVAIAHLPSPPLAADHPEGRVLDAVHPEYQLELPGAEVRRVVLDTHLTHAVELAAGTVVAVVRLEDRSGAWMEWPLRVGEDTGEWASSRPDLARREDLAAPPPWLSQVVSEGGGPWFLAHRYRAVIDSGPTVHLDASRLSLRRLPGLPPQVTLAVFHLEVDP